MSFWSYNIAAPKLWHTFWGQGFLRQRPALKPYTYELYLSRRLDSTCLDQFALFLKQHYGDDDWYLDTEGNWLQSYLDDPNVIVLGLFKKYDNTLIATILSVPITSGETNIGNTTTLKNVRVIEGLCIHKKYRKQGFAAHMISLMDYETSKKEPCVHLWSRELTQVPVFSTFLQTKLYGYIECAWAKKTWDAEKLPWDEFVQLWEKNVKNWIEPSSIVTNIPSNRRNGLTAWKITDSETVYIIVVSDTKRRSYLHNHHIWETIWCGKIDTSGLKPSTIPPECIESVASIHKGLFFIMKEYSDTPFSKRWRIGQSGYHVWYMYNYIPPNFGSCEIHSIREEI